MSCCNSHRATQAKTVIIIPITSTTKKDESEDRGQNNSSNLHTAVSALQFIQEIIPEGLYPKSSKPLIRVVASTVKRTVSQWRRSGAAGVQTKHIILKEKLHFRSGDGK